VDFLLHHEPQDLITHESNDCINFKMAHFEQAEMSAQLPSQLNYESQNMSRFPPTCDPSRGSCGQPSVICLGLNKGLHGSSDNELHIQIEIAESRTVDILSFKLEGHVLQFALPAYRTWAAEIHDQQKPVQCRIIVTSRMSGAQQTATYWYDCNNEHVPPKYHTKQSTGLIEALIGSNTSERLKRKR